MTDTEKDLAVHVAVCEQRYNQINTLLQNGRDRMTRIEYILYAVIASVLLGPGALAEFVKRLF